MLHHIVSHTPVWVWVILGFLIYRGFIASMDREVAIKKVIIIPLVMLLLSLQGILSGFGAEVHSLGSWLLALLIGMFIAWHTFNPDNVRVSSQHHSVSIRGSWVPMSLMMAIFCLKYGVNVMIALNPAIRTDMVFMLANCLLFGILSGIFLGNMARVLLFYRQQTNGLQFVQV